ncbi:hypothetical protein L9G74_20485, partial [Shewanella sp. C32]|nr:hypothetical protein [Shewanella electrica]
VRNIFVHKRGFVDDEFIKRQSILANEACFAPFVSLLEKEPIKLTGSSVREHKNPAIDLAIDLVCEVDLWLTDNP